MTRCGLVEGTFLFGFVCGFFVCFGFCFVLVYWGEVFVWFVLLCCGVSPCLPRLMTNVYIAKGALDLSVS